MAIAPINVSYDGSPVQFRMDSPLLACFDPLALDMLGELLRVGASMDVPALLERANAHHPAVACFTIPDFQPGLYTLDPHDIKKFGDEEEDFDYNEPGRDQERTPGCTRPSAAYASLGLVRRPGLIFRQAAERRPARYVEARCLASTPSCPCPNTAS